MSFIISFCSGVFAGMLGFSILDGWQAWAIIIAVHMAFTLGERVGRRGLQREMRDEFCVPE